MNRIIIGTTPTITYTFKVVPVSSIVKAVLTVKERGENIIEKDLSDATVGEDTLSWTLTQEETLAIGARGASIMLNWLTADGVHPNELGYRTYWVPQITAWLKTL